MELGQTTSPAEQVRHPQGGPTADRGAADRQRADVFHPDGLPVANAAQRLRPLADGPSLLPYLAPGWNVAEDSRRPPPQSTRPGGSKSQSLRGDHRQPIGENRGKRGARGYDAGKKIKGRKRHIVVDTLGLLLAVVVHSAHLQDRDGAKLVLAQLVGKFSRLKLIWADGGYAGKLIEWTKEVGHWILEIVKRSDDVTGFQVLPKRWIVERTFAWFGRYRRLSKDYETLTDSSEAIIYLAMIHLMLRRLKPCVV
jgi:transposase